MDTDSEIVEDNKFFPDWKNVPTIEALQTIVDDATVDYEKHISDIEGWKNNYNATGSAAVQTPKGRSKVVPKLIRKQAEWRYSSLAEPFLSTPDLFNVNPITAGDVNRSKQNELVLNNQFNTKLNKVAFIDSYVRDCVDLGTAIVKVGWETKEEEVTEDIPIFNFTPAPELVERYTALVQLQQQDPERYADISTVGLDQALAIFMRTGQAMQPVQVGSNEVTGIKETENHPTVEVVDHHNLILDPTCGGDIDKAEFVIEKFKSSIAALKKDGKYHNLDDINIETAESPQNNPYFAVKDDDNTFNFGDRARKQFVVYTYWGTWDVDDNNTTRSIVISWVGDTIIRMELNPFPDRKIPFVLVKEMPVRDSSYGEPDGVLIEDNQKIVGAVTRGMIDILGRSANGQTGIRKDMLDATNRRKFQRKEDYEFNANVDPRQGIYHHIFPEIPQSAYNMLTLQNAEAESFTGVKAFNTGISGQSLGSTATSVRGALDAASKRELSILRRLADGIIKIGHKIISMNSEFLSEEEVVRITNNQFVTVRRDDLAGNFDLRLTISTAEEDNQKAQELAFMLQTTAQSSDPGEVRMIRAEIARLRKMPELAKRIEEFQPQPDPIAQAKAQLEIKLLEAQIQKELSLVQKHGSTAGLDKIRGIKEFTQGELNRAKIGTEAAKAKLLGSDADRKDLDYLEQSTGTHQERDLQKIDRKAQRDNEAKILDKIMNNAPSNGANKSVTAQ